jgi:hypothetical protein
VFREITPPDARARADARLRGVWREQAATRRAATSASVSAHTSN